MAKKRKYEIYGGEVYGSITILKEVEPYQRPKGGKKRRVLCKCSCGEEFTAPLTNIISGHTKSCGCLRVESAKNMYKFSQEKYQKEDYIGKTFGKLTVIAEEEPHIFPNSPKRRRFLCRCECGNEVSVLLGNLRNGGVQSCGCLQREVVSKVNRKFNTYNILGDITEVYDEFGNKTIIDTVDLHKIKPFYWYLDSRGYFSGGKTSLHRFITDCPKGIVVDHINHDKTDNRRSNLKLCSQKDNNKNRPFIGVVYLEHTDTWIASKKVGGELVYSAQCKSIEDAFKLYKEL